MSIAGNERVYSNRPDKGRHTTDYHGPITGHPFIKRTLGCWEWAGCHNRRIDTNGYRGYASVRRGKQNLGVHRLLYEEWYGPIPEGKELDHLCRNSWCINPEHLEAVGKSEHAYRTRGHYSWLKKIEWFYSTGEWSVQRRKPKGVSS